MHEEMNLPIKNGLTVAIQAGGKSTRMGQDKSFVLLDGRPLIEIVAEITGDLGDELILITNKPADYAHLGWPIYGDIYPDHGPLGGIYTAVSYATFSHTLVVACDMPWLSRPLLQHLVSLKETADIVVPRWDKFPEPLHAVYSKTCLSPMAANLATGRLKITGFYGKVKVRFVDREEIVQFRHFLHQYQHPPRAKPSTQKG